MKIILTLLISIFCLANDVLEWAKLTKEQRNNAKLIYMLIPHNEIALTMIAIAWQESRLGLVNINLHDPSCGLMHVHIRYYLIQNKIKDMPLNRNKYCSILIDDIVLNIDFGLQVFNRFLRHYKGDYHKAIKAYNAGYNINSKQADIYLKSILAHRAKIRLMFAKGLFNSNTLQIIRNKLYLQSIIYK